MRFLTRLNVLVDHNMYLDQFMDKLPNLVELGLHILTKTLRFLFLMSKKIII